MQNILFWLKKNGKDIIFFGLIVGCFTLAFYNFWLLKQEQDNNDEAMAFIDNEVINENPDSNTDAELAFYYVDIKGAVAKPGVYQVKAGTIVDDVVTLAGGFKSDAYIEGINLSKKVTDELVIYVYTKKERAEQEKEVGNESNSCASPTYDICECLNDKASIIEVGSSSNEMKNDNSSLVNINKATVTELMSLTGVGEAKAKAIVEYRNLNGNFKTPDEIMKVSGIGEAVFDKIKNSITV